MKKLILSIALIFAASSSILIAGENKFCLNEIKKSIAKKISVPENLKKANFTGYVLVSFNINAEGRIQVIAINSTNADLMSHVEEQMEKMRIKGKLETGKEYSLRLDFKVL